MNLPEGPLLKSRVVSDPRDPLAEALDRELTGYAVLEPQETLLLDADGRGVLTFRDGVPELAYDTGTDRGGPAALADLATTGPYHAELYALDGDALDSIPVDPALSVPPGMAAERLAGDPALAASTRRAAPADRDGSNASTEAVSVEDRRAEAESAVEAFLEDEEKIRAIREQARREAEARAEEWGLE